MNNVEKITNVTDEMKLISGYNKDATDKLIITDMGKVNNIVRISRLYII